MNAQYKSLLLTLALGIVLSFASCQEDEDLNLVTYPENQPSMTIQGTEGASKVQLNAIYTSDGTLELDGPVTRTYTFRFLASPEDATVDFEVLSTNIPAGNIEINPTKVLLPAGTTDASVTVTLKNEDFSFAQSNYDAETYELGVKANVAGYKIGTEPVESKVVIKKEAYVASCAVVGLDGNTVSFERAYSKGVILNTDPISYTFKMQLDKPARKDVKVKLSVEGLEDQFKGNISVSPSDIIIPAGELSTEDITWSITDDFLLQTAEEESHILTVIASVESEDPVVQMNEERNALTFNVDKVLRNFEYLPNIVDSWIELSKANWSVSLSTGRSGSVLIDGKGGGSASDVYVSSDELWFIVDMKDEKTIKAFGIDYYQNYNGFSSPRKVAISTSSDNESWVNQGVVSTPQMASHYFQLYEQVNARYIKVELSMRYNSYLDLTEIYVYGTE